jgi:hypothetical protein
VQGGQENQIGPDLIEQLRAGSGILPPFFRSGRAEDDVGGKAVFKAAALNTAFC